MRNLNLLNRFTKLQAILITKNSQSTFFSDHTSYTCNVLPVQQKRCVATQIPVTRYRKNFLTRVLTAPRYSTIIDGTVLQTADAKDKAFSDISSTTLEEFRARETARDEEHERRSDYDGESDKDAKKAKADAIRMKILDAALKQVPSLGWTRNAIVKGAEDSGFPSVVHGMFPEGGFALVAYFNGKCNDEIVNYLRRETANGTLEISNPAEFLTAALQRRLEMIVPYKQQWPQALALIALPQNAPTALAQLLTLVDDICYYSGDRSVDMGWYTRRIGLATIFKMTELYMLQDSSSQHNQTWVFLNNRMDEAIQIQSVLLETSNITDKFQTSFNAAFVTARNMLGLGYTRN